MPAAITAAMTTLRPTDDDDLDEDADPALRLPPGSRNYITPGGHARLRAELEHLVRVERPQVVSIVQWAAANGDRSENADYTYGKRRLREIDRRIRFLGRRLDLAQIVDPAQRQPTDHVFFGATVTLCDERGDENTYQIVGIDETDFARGRISWRSPMALALLKAREGDSVRFRSPAGWREVDIVAVTYRAIQS